MREILLNFSSKYRVFTYYAAGALALFLAFHFFTWEIFTKQILGSQKPMYVGDLARISYQPNSVHVRADMKLDLPKRHIQSFQWDGKPVDIITMGDSFSIGGGGGVNPFYQDYIATQSGLRIMNINRLPQCSDYMENIIIWINSGLLDVLKPKVIVLESIGRSSIGRFSHTMNWEENASVSTIYKAMKTDGKAGFPDVPMINTGNYKYYTTNFFYLFSHNAFGFVKVHKYLLDRKLFESKTPNTLLFYDEDVGAAHSITHENVDALNENMNHLADLLAQKGIKLVFMPAVDKYDLYEKYIIDNPLPANHFFDFLSPLDKRYIFINTKEILKPLVEENVTDVYHGDDTHWSFKAPRQIAQSVSFADMVRTGTSAR
jgi:hypothetical protein